MLTRSQERQRYKEADPVRYKLLKNKYSRNWKRTKSGYIHVMFGGMATRQKKLGRTLSFKIAEFREFLKTTRFDQLYQEWVDIGRKRSLTPTVDRIDELGNYQLDNIQILTLAENIRKWNRFKVHAVREYIKQHRH